MKKTVNKIFTEYTIWIALVVLTIVFSLTSKYFLTVKNIMNILNQSVTIGIMAAGVVFVQIAGGVDLSVGAQISISGIVASTLMVKFGVNPVLACIIAIALCVGIGAINGILVTRMKIIAIIATMGVAQILQGLSYIICKGQGVFGMPKSFAVLGQGYVGPVPVSVIIYAIIVMIVNFVLNKTYFGRYFYSVGGNPEASRLAGIDPMRVKFVSYLISGFFCGISGMITLSRMNVGLASTGLSLQMDVMTSVVLGGISAMVARNTVGKYSGVVAGSITMAVISVGMVLAGASEYFQLIIKGAILLLALSMDSFDIDKLLGVFRKKEQ